MHRKNTCLALSVLAFVLLCSPVAMASASSDKSAYDAAIKCFVTDGYFAGDKRAGGDSTMRAIYEKKARTSFDVASALGQRLGYTGSRVNQDFGLAQTDELPKLATDEAHVKHMLKICDTLGL